MRPSNFLCLLLAVTSVALCHADEASSAPRKQDTPLGETVALVVFDVAKSVALFEGVSLAWMLSSWVLASLLQPAHGQLGEGFFLPMVQSIIGKPVSPGDAHNLAPERLVDRLTAHHHQLIHKAEHLVLRLPAVLRGPRFSRAYADAAILRLCAKPLVVPSILLFIYKLIWSRRQ